MKECSRLGPRTEASSPELLVSGHMQLTLVKVSSRFLYSPEVSKFIKMSLLKARSSLRRHWASDHGPLMAPSTPFLHTARNKDLSMTCEIMKSQWFQPSLGQYSKSLYFAEFQDLSLKCDSWRHAWTLWAFWGDWPSASHGSSFSSPVKCRDVALSLMNNAQAWALERKLFSPTVCCSSHDNGLRNSCLSLGLLLGASFKYLYISGCESMSLLCI